MLELIECKRSAGELPPALRQMKAKFREATATLVVAEPVVSSRTLDGIEIRSAWEFLGRWVYDFEGFDLRRMRNSLG